MRATVFGLDVQSDALPSYLQGAEAPATGRPLAASVQADASPARDWPRDAELVCDEHRMDGSVLFQIEAHPDAGYLIHGPEYGTHRLSGDGRSLLSAPEGLPDAAWQRLLIAQVLPFAALLQGLEVFHASAVVLDGSAVALLGPSHAGKTSLALELCAGGASFLADDVLALEARDEELLAHPGTPVAGLDRQAPQSAGEVLAADERERIVRVDGSPAPAPLGALFFLDRRQDGQQNPVFEPVSDPLMLLSATFNFVLESPERLQRLLEVSSLAAMLRVERILIGPGCDSTRIAQGILKRLGSAR